MAPIVPKLQPYVACQLNCFLITSTSTHIISRPLHCHIPLGTIIGNAFLVVYVLARRHMSKTLITHVV